MQGSQASFASRADYIRIAGLTGLNIKEAIVDLTVKAHEINDKNASNLHYMKGLTSRKIKYRDA